ncbi:MAG: nuclear transport factor 2 family protein [Spirochaetes bacterium]|nr:MAG: nuclear transport factor 2 family protein [Spirochaetota bacterium]
MFGKALHGSLAAAVMCAVVCGMPAFACGGAGDLAEKERIIDTVNTLFVSTDNRDWGAVKACFADEVLFDMTSMAGGSPAKLKPGDIADMWDKGLKPLKAVHHQAGNYRVTLKGGGADVFCYGIALHWLPNPTNVNVRAFVGSYDFHLVQSGAAWKIDKFKFNLKFIEGNKDLEKAARP